MKPSMKNYRFGCAAQISFSPRNPKKKKYKAALFPHFSPKKNYFLPGGYISTVAKVKNVNWEVKKPVRAGIIVYNYYQGKLLFCVGVDSKSKELTDFGGGISYKLDKNTVRGAIREFTEESLGVFGEVKEEDLQECLVVYTYSMAIIFLPLSLPPLEVTELFTKRYKREKVAEVSSLAWMTSKTLLDILFKRNKEEKFYVKVEKLLCPVIYKVLALI